VRAALLVVDRLADNPYVYAEVLRDIRRAPLPKFPYGLYYRIEPDQSVVVACLHGSRDLRLVRSRFLKPDV
jgi:toxin ParE1/3/4